LDDLSDASIVFSDQRHMTWNTQSSPSIQSRCILGNKKNVFSL